MKQLAFKMKSKPGFADEDNYPVTISLEEVFPLD
jgi:hypothetical protein